MHIDIEGELRIQPERPGAHEHEGMEEGSRFYRAMQHLVRQDLGGGWAIEPGNTDEGRYRLSLTLHGRQAAVFDENRSGSGAPSRPHMRLHPLITRQEALSTLELALNIGIRAADRMWDAGAEPVVKSVDDPFEADLSDIRQEPSYG
ncbi:hypothetical protein [Paracoccus sp. ME4]|uniref:hypothetical protein n=1 Tax=Paracoccus sp. ME4 TaxID=3138066 RepID=UPI00398A6A51